MQLEFVQLPPEIIDIIYNFIDVKSKIKLSVTNSYIYDCRPVDALNYHKWKSVHRKNILLSLDCIKSTSHYVVESGDEHLYQVSRRISDRSIVTYKYTCASGTLRSKKFIPYKGWHVRISSNYLDNTKYISR